MGTLDDSIPADPVIPQAALSTLELGPLNKGKHATCVCIADSVTDQEMH